MGLLALFLVAGIIVFFIINKRHTESEYYKQTHKSIFEVTADRGSWGEYEISKSLENISGYSRMIYNCYIPKSDGTTTEIDVLMIHEKGIYVIESKNYSGWIFGTETDKYWTQSLRVGRGHAKKYKFYNPIMQNQTHVKWLEKYLVDLNFTIPFYSCIVFGNSCELKNITLTSNRHAVLNEYYLYELVQNHVNLSCNVFSAEQIDVIYNKLFQLTQKSNVEKMMHINNVRNVKQANSSNYYNRPTYNQSSGCNKKHIPTETKQKVCKMCGGKMILRTAHSGANQGNRFWGCENYPKCRYTEKNS